MSAHRDSPDDILSAVENENTVSAFLQVSRYCPLVLQSCTVAAVPVIEHRVCRCHGAISMISRIR